MIIMVAFIPLFTMTGVPGKIFAPMSLTYTFALLGALVFALIFAPVLASFEGLSRPGAETWLSAWFRKHYDRQLMRLLKFPKLALLGACGFLVASAGLFHFVGGEFMPPLEEGNLWIRATLPPDVSVESSTTMAAQIRDILLTFPEVTRTISQVGRPDDGTDTSTFNNIEVSVQLKPLDQWSVGMTKTKLIEQIQKRFEQFPGVDFNFSQNIQDNVEEAMSGVKGENSLKLFGDDFDQLTTQAAAIGKIMTQVKGVEDVGVFKVSGQPSLTITIDHERAARYGLMANDLNAVVQAAIGGNAVTQIVEGDRRFDLVVRYQKQYRETPEAIRNIILNTP